MLPFTPAQTTSNEKTTLVEMLEMQRSILLWKLDGLSFEDATRPMVASGTNILGVIKHMAYVERWWFIAFMNDRPPSDVYPANDPDADFRIDPDETIESVSQLYVDAVAASNAVVAAAESLEVLGSLVDAEKMAPERRSRSLRWVLVHMIEETARHAGQLDIIREQLDTTTGYYPG